MYAILASFCFIHSYYNLKGNTKFIFMHCTLKINEIIGFNIVMMVEIYVRIVISIERIKKGQNKIKTTKIK